MATELQETLSKEYDIRFRGREAERSRVWKILVGDFFQPVIGRDKRVLDLGCGYGEFINQVQGSRRYGMDLNPDSACFLLDDVTFLHQDCSQVWPLEDNSLDVVFTSNFFEHLPHKEALACTLQQVYRCLKTGGQLVCMGPNIRYLGGQYWDFWDHHVPLTDASMVEALRLHGFALERVHPRFLPYSMSSGRVPANCLIRAYLRFPLLWRLFGKQFLVVGRKQGGET